MGQQAENKDDQDQTTTIDETTDTEVIEDGAEGEEKVEGSEGDGPEEPAEVEIVLDGDTQPKEAPRGFLKRINKLNGKVADAKAQTSEVQEKSNLQAEEIKVLRMALEQGQNASNQQPLEMPNPDDFDGGTYDPDYTAKVNEYTGKKIQAEVQKGVAEATKQTNVSYQQAAQSQELEKAQKKHIERSIKLGVKDYEEKEDIAIAILGKESINHLIQNVDKSELLFYYFGDKPHIAEKYAAMLIKQPIRALTEIGGLVERIKVKPKTETNPDPDTELEGGTPSNMEHLQNKLNKLRDAARNGGSDAMKKIADFKKEQKAKGIKLR